MFILQIFLKVLLFEKKRPIFFGSKSLTFLETNVLRVMLIFSLPFRIVPFQFSHEKLTQKSSQ
jgi:hypothetical protein